MPKVIIATATHNNLKYTKLFLDSIVTSFPYEVFVIDNGSTDGTPGWLLENDYNCILYQENRGFSYAYNDAMDYTFTEDENLLLFAANDTVLYPKCIDNFVKAITESDFDMFCGFEVLNKSILDDNKEALDNFKYSFSFDDKDENGLVYEEGGLNHSCIIRNKSVFSRVGYYDVNFYPAYFEDNDYARRCNLLGVKYGTMNTSVFKHFWSRTIKEGGAAELSDRRFNNNKEYYINKWGGFIGKETFDKPFNSNDIEILSRKEEFDIIRQCF